MYRWDLAPTKRLRCNLSHKEPVICSQLNQCSLDLPALGPSRLKDTMADVTLTEAAALAGIDLSTDCLTRYLHAIGLRSHATIAVYVHEDAVVSDLLTKLKAGVTVGTTEYKLPADAEENAVKAQWLVLSRHARHKYQASFQATPTPNSAPSQPTPTTQPDKDNIPKTLPSGVYSKLVEDYNSITLDGVRRVFPEKLLLGAEKVLARMYHEHHTSKLYTATPLGEIMAQRVWTSFNTINSNRKKDPSEKKLILDDKNPDLREGTGRMGRQRTVDAHRRHTGYPLGLDIAQVRLRDRHQQVRRLVSWIDPPECTTDPQCQTPLGRFRMGHCHEDALHRNTLCHNRRFDGGHREGQRDPSAAPDEEDQIHQGQRLPVQQQRQGLSAEVVTSGERTKIPDVLSLDCIGNLDTVASIIYVVATPTAYVDVAANAASMVHTYAYNAAYAYTYANDTFQPCTDSPTATYVVAQRKREGRKEQGQEGQVWEGWQEIGTARPSVPRHRSRPSNHRRRQ